MMGPQVGDHEENFFQSDRDIKLLNSKKFRQENLYHLGDPIQLQSKILHFEILNHHAYVAQSAFVIQKLDLLTGEELFTLKGHKGPVTSVAVERKDGQVISLISGSWDKTIKKWDVESQKCLFTCVGHDDFVKCVKIVNNIIYSASTDGTIGCWDFNTGESLGSLIGHGRSVEDLVIDPTGTIMYSCSSDRTIRKWNLIDRSEMQVLEGHDTSIYALYMDWDNEVLWSVSGDKTARRWDLETGNVDSTLNHPDFVKSLTLLSNGFVVTGCRDENFRIWNPSTEECVKTVEAHFDEVSCIQTIGGVIWTGSLDGTLRKWHLEELLNPKETTKVVEEVKVEEKSDPMMTEEEERELMELMDD
ncbi:WD40-repeat-containing domain protein [Globomyces pollinis-pini]|nr:WD40-repeat-containing domain protein [Globomyces pollinis-pini]